MPVLFSLAGGGLAWQAEGGPTLSQHRITPTHRLTVTVWTFSIKIRDIGTVGVLVSGPLVNSLMRVNPGYAARQPRVRNAAASVSWTNATSRGAWTSGL